MQKCQIRKRLILQVKRAQPLELLSRQTKHMVDNSCRRIFLYRLLWFAEEMQLEIGNFFRQQWKHYEVARELIHQKMAVRLASLRSIMGKECLQIYRNLSLTPEQQESVQGYLEALEAYFKPQRNVVYERYVFNSCVQDEHVDAYVNRLRKLASSSVFL